jgi:hypothetical protein
MQDKPTSLQKLYIGGANTRQPATRLVPERKGRNEPLEVRNLKQQVSRAGALSRMKHSFTQHQS